MIENENTNSEPIVTGDTTPKVEPATGSEAETLINVERLIQTHLEQLENLKAEAKKYAEMLSDILINSGVYAEHEQAAKEAIKTKNITKKDLLKDPGAQEIAQKVKSFKSEMKEHQASLSYFLAEYAKQTGSSTFEDINGEIRDIVYVAKLVKKK